MVKLKTSESEADATAGVEMQTPVSQSERAVAEISPDKIDEVRAVTFDKDKTIDETVATIEPAQQLGGNDLVIDPVEIKKEAI